MDLGLDFMMVVICVGSLMLLAGAYFHSSDRSLKSNLEDLREALPKVNQLQVPRYHYANAHNKTIGFIAQDVAPIFPELVHYSEADKLYGTYCLISFTPFPFPYFLISPFLPNFAP